MNQAHKERALALKAVRGRYFAITVAASAALFLSSPVRAASIISLGPHSVQSLVTSELFNRGGRWFLIDDAGVCSTYLESPRVHLNAGRLVLTAHMSSLLGQRVGDTCLGAGFSSNVTLSGHVRGEGHQLILDEIRIDRVDDESTRNALALALQLNPQALPRSATIDISDYLKTEVKAGAGVTVHLEQFRILNIVTEADAIVIQFEIGLTLL